MDEHHDLVFIKPQRLGAARIKHPLHVLDFQKVIAGTQRADLRQAALFRMIAHHSRVCAVDGPALLAVGQVLRRGHSRARPSTRRPPGAVCRVGIGNPDVAALPRARGNVAKQLVHQFANLGLHFLAGQRTAEQTHAAVDVKSHATR